MAGLADSAVWGGGVAALRRELHAGRPEARTRAILSSRTAHLPRDIESYMAEQVFDASHREIVGPVFPARGGSGEVLPGGREVARCGEPAVI